jgi:hypothetical protein
MQTLSKLLTVLVLSSNLLDVHIYDDQCVMQARYVAEQVFVNADQAYMDIILPNDQSIHIPFKYGVKEAQISYEHWFRSYQYEDGKIKEYKEPYCRGAM